MTPNSPSAVSFPDRLRSLIGSESLQTFGDRCGLSSSLLHRYLKGSVPGMDKLIQIAQAAGVSLDWLAIGQETIAAQPGLDEYIYIPLYDVSASAGGGSVVDAEPEVNAFGLHHSWIRDTLRTSPKGLEMIYVRGESMEPTLHSGDIVLLDRKVTDVMEGIYVLHMEGNLFVKRLHRLPGKQLRVISDNPTYEPILVNLQPPPDDFSVLGKVVWSFHAH